MEFKGLSVNIDFPACGSHINRITVEFKVLLSGISVAFAIILIESQWNLKAVLLIQISLCLSILIESQWNLKGGDGKDCKTCKCILIESQWNLKDDYIIDKDYHWKNINRITVEFKVESEY